MSVQVIMKDGRPEWAVIPYAQYEALLVAAGQTSPDLAVSPVTNVAAPTSSPVKSTASFFAGMKTSDQNSATFNAERFAAIKAEQGKTSSAIAKDAGISPAYCDQIERGERQPSPAIIRGLAQALKINPDDLLG